jgi:hypoxanthine phosphoribosyltransferase
MKKEVIKKINISSETITEAAEKLSEKLKKLIKGDDIYLVGINRGGLIPLGYLSYFLNTRNTKIIDINLYPNDEFRNYNEKDISDCVNQIQFINFLPENSTVIFVDELFDTASTFKVVDQALKKVNIKCQILYATLFGKPNDLNIIYGMEKPKGWLVFPWD